MTTRIVIITHALTQWNVDGRIQGHTDTPLNRTGRKMAILLAERLKNEKIGSIYTSDLRRAYETAEPLAKIKNLAIIRDMRLREGRSMNQERESEYPVLHFPKEFENEDDVRRRMIEALTEIAEDNPGESVLVVSHGGAVEIFISHILKASNDNFLRYHGKRTALNILQYEACIWKCLSLNDDRHLLGMDISHIHANYGQELNMQTI